MNVLFYKNLNDRRVVNKSFTDQPLIKQCELWQGTELISPQLVVASVDINTFSKNYNYCYISNFNRYYYIDRIEYLSYNNVRVYLSLDVLRTYMNEIKNLTCYISRQEKKYNKMINDTSYPVTTERNVKHRIIGRIENNPSYCLTVTGGSTL